MEIILILLISLLLVGWVSYYTSGSVYRSLQKNDNKYARLVQVLVFIVMFSGLLALSLYIVAENLAFQR